jgi:hypothetical protein
MKTILALNSTLHPFSTGTLPEELLLVPAGQFDGRSWSSPNPQLVINATKDYGLDLAVDVEHATEIKGPKGEAAHIKKFCEASHQ